MRFECGHQVLGVLETMDPTAEGVDSVRQWASDIGSQNDYPLMAWTVVLAAFGHLNLLLILILQACCGMLLK